MVERCQNHEFCFNESSILETSRLRPFSRLKIVIQHLLDAYKLPYQLDLPEFNRSFQPSMAFVAFLWPLDPIFWIQNFLFIIVLMDATFIQAPISAISCLKICFRGFKIRTLCSGIKHCAPSPYHLSSPSHHTLQKGGPTMVWYQSVAKKTLQSDRFDSIPLQHCLPSL